MASTPTLILDGQMARPPSNYQPSDWNHEFLMKNLKNHYKDEAYSRRATALQENIRHQICHMYEEKGQIALLEFINDIERLGLGYIFKQDIHSVLSFLEENNIKPQEGLYETALYFRLFRLHGLSISQDVFKVFKDLTGYFNEHLNKDIKGMWSLFEACYHAEEGEDILDEAKVYTRNILKNVKHGTDDSLYDQVTRALRIPINYNAVRFEARWYIDAYSEREDTNQVLLELAKLDYNIRQGSYQDELAILSTWWNDLGVAETLPYVRDSLIQAFAWCTGVADLPQHKYCRHWYTKYVMLITIADDTYDNYASLDEAKLLTEAVERWDIKTVDELPRYMKLVFLAWYNTTNELAYNIFRDQGLNILPYLREKIEELFQTYMVELIWFKTGYMPSFKEYLDHAAISVTGPILYLLAYVLISPKISIETLDYIVSYPDVIRLSTTVFRLLDDLATSKYEMERGDVPKAVQCYMHQEGVTEVDARKYLWNLTDETEKKLHTAVRLESSLPPDFIDLILNANRMTHALYQYGDGYGHPGSQMKQEFSAVIFDSVMM
ncbi:hypothetical protein ACHQM5_013231 [Ranunculus cassubicifolius]